ncbi:MAG: hypothetical protein IJT02_08140 [Synergistaceae bacterium]|nr:hypothetical protein [Synergistaceae bacterium]
MKKATESAAKWLAGKAKADPKLNPIPYPFFKSIISKQVEWAAKRGVALNFTELAEAVRTELLKSGIHTMADSRPAQPVRKDTADTGGAIPPLLLQFGSLGEAMCAITIFDWLQTVFQKAHAANSSGVELSARIDKEARR